MLSLKKSRDTIWVLEVCFASSSFYTYFISSAYVCPGQITEKYTNFNIVETVQKCIKSACINTSFGRYDGKIEAKK